MVSAAHGRFDVATRSMSDAQADHYLGWARAYHELVGAETSFSDGVVFHLWHGAVKGRRYRRRHDVLKRFRFDPLDDIAHAAEGGWRWSSAKPELHAQVRDYFVARDEDG